MLSEIGSIEKSYFIDRGKDEMIFAIRNVFPELTASELHEYLEKMIKKGFKIDKDGKSRFKNPSLLIHNNYRNRFFRHTVISLYDYIFKNHLIIGGFGCLYWQHEEKENPFIDYIITNMNLRDQYKSLRKTHKNDKELYILYDRKQLNTKIKINSLYGVLGYHRFFLYNLFLAASITSMGQHIITSASTGFENFLSDNCPFFTMNELIKYIKNITLEARDSSIDHSNIPEPTCSMIYERLAKKCMFEMSDKDREDLCNIIKNLNDPLVYKELYYKNNFLEFLKVPYIRERLEFIFTNINFIMLPEISKIDSEEVQEAIQEFWSNIKSYVFYNYPVFDRVRKGKYLDRKSVLYVDTDSNMLSIYKWVDYIVNDVMVGKPMKMDEREFVYTSASVIIIILTRVIDGILKTLCGYMNVTPEWSEKLIMKNEFFYERMLFTNVKKRYAALMTIKEGMIMNNGMGEPDIKGFDFIKAATKPSLKKFYIDLCLNDILREKVIDPLKIKRKLDKLREDILASLKNGDTEFYKNANVSIISSYKFPYRISGVKGVVLWNALFPDNMIELPSPVDLISIKSFNNKKYRAEFAEKHPDLYEILNKNFFSNPNPNISGMELNVIARPTNVTDLPDWFFELIDTEKILQDSLNLILPVTTSLGIKTLKCGTDVKYLSNIVSI